MTISTPQITPIRDFRIHQAHVMAKLENGPVYLAQRSRLAAVLVSPQLWETIVERLEMLEDAVAIFKSQADIANGNDEMITINPDTWEEIERPCADAKILA